MNCRPRSRLVLGLLLVCACYEQPVKETGTDTDVDTGAMTEPDDGATTCDPGAIESCVCSGGGVGEHACLPDGSGFGQCECEGADTTVGPECVGDGDCVALDGECEAGVCNASGQCEAQPRAAGDACGAAANSDCDGADTCDGAGNCVTNIAGAGALCTDCGDVACSCDGAGACAPCRTFADANDFDTDRTIVGWEVTGGWGLYIAAPQSYVAEPVVFGSQVFGTDGNRRVPYPLGEEEVSTATSRAFTLPDTITFSSWNVDEGGSNPSCYDDKIVSVSIDGGTTWTELVHCCGPGAPPAPFCENVVGPRAPDDWDLVSLPIPAEMIGQEGIVRFEYNSTDDCCEFEQGWFIDASNIAPECACQSDDSCATVGGECGSGVCGDTGQCGLQGRAAGTSCGSARAGDCTAADTCDGAGHCVSNDALNAHATCEGCTSGSCGGCVDGQCVDCPSEEYDPITFAGWTSEALEGTTNPGWGVYYDAPPTNVAGGVFTSFGARAPVIGSDGNRLSPYTLGSNTHSESSRWTTASFTVPAAITFESWNQDEGGFGSLTAYDYKRIEISVNGGGTWVAIADCAVTNLPFCQYMDARPIDQWDAISLDTSAFEGQTGMLRFIYDTQDAAGDFERGWFINDLNVLTQCADPIPAP